jgi:hypothetical protein
MPPSTFSIFDKIGFCTDSVCIEKIVDEYLMNLMRESVKGKDNSFKLFESEDDSVDEREFFNYYKFTESLLLKVIENELDLDYVINDLKERLGKTHPIVMLLRQLTEEE